MHPLHQHPGMRSRLLWPLVFGRAAHCPQCGCLIEVAGRWRYPVQTVAMLAQLLALGFAARLRLSPALLLLLVVGPFWVAQVLLARHAPRVAVTPAMLASRRYAAWGLVAVFLLVLALALYL